MLGEIRRAVRALLRRRVFSLAIVGTLAATVAAQFTSVVLLDSLVLRPVPYDDAGALVSLRWVLPTGPSGVRQSEGTYLVLRDDNRVFESVGITRSVNLTIESADGPIRVAGATATPDTYETLRLRPVLGRLFESGDSEPGAAPVVVLSHAEWVAAHGQSPRVIGTSLVVDGTPREIIGVQSPDVGFPLADARVVLPTKINTASPDNRSFFHEAIGRLRAGKTLQDATADLERLKGRLTEVYPGTFPPSLGEQVRPLAVSLREFVGGPLRPTMLAVLVATSLLLVVALANMGSLLTARTAAREQELALRAAIGAPRGALLGTQAAEPAVLVTVGTLAGWALTGLALAVFGRLSESWGGPSVKVGTPLMLSMVVGLGLLIWLILTGFAVRWQADAGRATRRGGLGGLGTQEWMYTSQVGITVVLMVAALGLTSSFARLLQSHPGFSADNVVAARLSVSEVEYPDWDRLAEFHRSVLDRTADQPGVRRVGLSNYLPLRDGRVYVAWYPEDDPPLPGEFSDQVLTKAVSDGYFEAMGVQLLEGRTLTRDDWARDAPPVAVVNEVAADLFWGRESALGRRIQRGENLPAYEVVGVVRGVRDRRLTDAPPPIVYQRLDAQALSPGYDVRTVSLAVAHEPGASPSTSDFRRVLDGLDPGVALFAVERMERTVRRAQDRLRITAFLLVALAASGLLLSVIGLYGGISYRFSTRAREIGVRIALGASFPRVARQTLAVPAVAVIFGIVAGIIAAGLAAPLLRFVAEDADVGVVGRAGVGLVCALVAALATLPTLTGASRKSVAAILGANDG